MTAVIFSSQGRQSADSTSAEVKEALDTYNSWLEVGQAPACWAWSIVVAESRVSVEQGLRGYKGSE